MEKENKSKKKVSVSIDRAENGFTVKCYYENHDELGESKQFIYETIEEVAKALPVLFSVSEAEAPEEDDKSLKSRKEKINKGKETN